MASVYRAYDNHLACDVAIKVIRRESFAAEIHERLLKRFEREARVLARLNHPNIVPVIDYGEHEGAPFLVMRYMPGGTLKQRMTGQPMPAAEAARLLLPVAQALEYAHQSGILHRDVKPSNILITETSMPVLTDFGIARLLESGEGHTLTGTGIGIGTPEYMAPEQGLGRNVDARADVYALGVVFYELLTGRRPFEADTPMAVVFLHLTEPLPSPQQYAPGLPVEVEKILSMALAKKPEDRYPGMAEFAAALERVIATHLVGKETAPVKEKPRGIGDIFSKRSAEKDPAARTPLPAAKTPLPAAKTPLPGEKTQPPGMPAPAAAITIDTGHPGSLPQAPNQAPEDQPFLDKASTSFFAARPERRVRIRPWVVVAILAIVAVVVVVAIYSAGILRLPGRQSGTAGTPTALSGVARAGTADTPTAVRATFTGAATALPTLAATPVPPTAAPTATAFSTGPTATPQATQATPSNATLPPNPDASIINAANAARLLESNRLGLSHTVNGMSVSPDGGTIAIGFGNIELYDAETMKFLREIRTGTSVGLVAYSPDGLFIAGAVDADTTVRIWQVADGKLYKTIVLPQTVTCLAYAPDAMHLATCDKTNEVRVIDIANARQERKLAGQSKPPRSVAFSPDSRYLVAGGGSGVLSVWRIADGVETWRSTEDQGTIAGVAFSPDGLLVASAGSDGVAWVYRLSDGSNLAQLKHDSAETLFGLVFSNDSQAIITLCLPAEVSIWTFDPPHRIISRGNPYGTERGILVLTQDGRRVVVGEEFGTLRLYSIP
jgi:serine/threonine protein kinase